VHAAFLKAGTKLSELSLEMYALEASVSVNPKYSGMTGSETG
jgi:hypothetical protein